MYLTRSIAEKVVEKKNILFSYAWCKRQEAWGELRSCSFGILNKTKENFHFHPESEIRKLHEENVVVCLKLNGRGVFSRFHFGDKHRIIG